MPQYDRKTLHNPSKAEVAKHHFNKLFDELNDLDARYLTGYVERKPYLAQRHKLRARYESTKKKYGI